MKLHNKKKIVFHGKASNPSIHRKLLSYLGLVENEIQNVTGLTNVMQPHYRLALFIKPQVNIQTEGYTFSDYRMTLDFNAISSLLMGEKIYGSRTLGLRELIQNSIDACRIRQENEKATYDFGAEVYQPKIKLILNKKGQQVSIKDNGSGMSLDVIKKHFLNIGVSYYKSQEFLLKDFNYKPIGNFGIGFLSCFMLSNNVLVTTRYYKSKYKYTVELEKGIEYTSLTETEDIQFEGTEVSLSYQDFMSVFDNNIQVVKNFVSTYFLTDDFEFQIIDTECQSISNIRNSIRHNAELAQNTFKVNFSNHLVDLEGYAIIKTKHSFITSFKDLKFEGKLYTYNSEDGLKEVSNLESLHIAEYLQQQKIKYLAIPLVPEESEEDFHNGLKFTNDDVDEVINKLDRDLHWISILPPVGYYDFLEEEVIWDVDTILEDLYFEHLIPLGHCKDCKTKKFVRAIELFEGRKDELYMPFDANSLIFPSFFYSRNEKRKLFIRNVLIKDYHFNMPISSSIFEIESLVVNINSRRFIPDISRNNLHESETTLIDYMIGKAIHRGAREVMQLNTDEQSTLEAFIDYHYKKESELEKGL